MKDRQHFGVQDRILWCTAVVVVGLACVAAWLFMGPGKSSPRADASVTEELAESRASLPILAAKTSKSAGSSGLPESLSGTELPRLPVDSRGNLVRTRAVRDVFDYFLAAQNEVGKAELDALVQRAIKAQLGSTPAAAEAMTVWRNYEDYRKGLANLQLAGTDDKSGKPDFDAMVLALDQIGALASRSMGPWSDAFFGDELQRQYADVERIRLASDSRLSDADRAAGLAVLDEALPPVERAARERARQQQASIEAIAKMQKQGLPADVLQAQITQTLGAEAAGRVMQMQAAEQAWQARYADYMARVARIDRQGLSSQERNAQLKKLRQQLFPNANEALRAEALSR